MPEGLLGVVVLLVLGMRPPARRMMHRALRVERVEIDALCGHVPSAHHWTWRLRAEREAEQRRLRG